MGIRRFIGTVGVLLSVASPIVAQQPAAPAGGTDHVAAIKQSLQQSAAAMRQKTPIGAAPAGDSLTIDVNAATSVICGVTVATFTDSAKDAVALKVSSGVLPDGTVYAAATHLDVEAQNLAVAIENTGYKKAGS